MYTKHLWCDEFRKVVQQWLDGEPIPLKIKRGMNEHREACLPCGDFYNNLLVVTAVTEGLHPPQEYEPPDDVQLWKKILKDLKTS